MRLAHLVCLTACIAVWAPSWAQPPAGRADESVLAVRSDVALLDALIKSTLTFRLNQTPMHEAVEALAAAIGAPIVARFADHAHGLGIDPAQPITIDAANRSGLSILEEILVQCSSNLQCTWQLRRGFIEIGSKERLSAPAACELRLYPIADLTLDVPNFNSDHSAPGDDGLREQPLGMAVKLVQLIAETIEPGHWDYGQPMLLPEGRTPSPFTDENSDESKPENQASVQPWAIIRIWRDHLVVIAPDFIHRQLNGYSDTERPTAPHFGALQPSMKDEEKARVLGVLMHTPVTATWNEVTARQALTALSDLLGVSIIGWFRNDTNDGGIDPETPISMTAANRPAIDVLEELIERCEDFEDCTWQIRRGVLEVGSKRRLAAAAFRDTWAYELTDQLLEPPQSEFGNHYEPVNSPYVAAVLGQTNRARVRSGVANSRKSAQDILLELAEGIVELVEPGRWNVRGNRTYDSAARTADSSSRRDASWATLRFVGDRMIIAAPDFIHRQIGGYPRAIPPVPARELP